MKVLSTRLSSPLFDVLGFALGLALALALSWQARDLIWSLWLSSLVIGYLTIILGLVGAARRRVRSGGSVVFTIAFGLFMLGFFTVHFGGFHVGHAVFLSYFFPVVTVAENAFPLSPDALLLIVSSYWPWLLSAAIAERTALVQAWCGDADPDRAGMDGFNPARPYANVIRMHLLIFFFAACHFTGVDGVWIFCVVFAVYFFPWRLLRRAKSDHSPAERSSGP